MIANAPAPNRPLPVHLGHAGMLGIALAMALVLAASPTPAADLVPARPLSLRDP